MNKKDSLPILNYDEDTSTKYKNNHQYLPIWPFRLLMTGDSSCGKTNLVINLLNYLYYDKVYIYTKDITEPKYQKIKDFFDGICVEAKEKYGEDIRILELNSEIESVDNLIAEDEEGNIVQNLVIFDDFVVDKHQELIEEYFIRGRKKNASMIYISQSYFNTPKNVRLQCNYFVLYRINSKNEIREIIKDKALGIPSDDFEYLFNFATSEEYSFFLIDLKTKDKRLKFRRNFEPLKE